MYLTMKRLPLTFRADEETDQWIRAMAQETGKSITDVLKEAVAIYRYARTNV